MQHFGNWILVCSIVLFLSLPLTLLHGFTPLLDSTIRIASSNPFIETYAFWWTSLTYLAPFFFLMLFIFTHWVLWNNFAVTLHFFFFFFIIYLFETVDYNTLNFNEFLTSYSDYGLNVLLTNQLNKYHPFIFYLSTTLMFDFFLTSLLCWFRVVQFSINEPQVLAYRAGWRGIAINFIALFMGSWWALQEGTWGGWWNWDSSETLGLEVALVLLITFHTSYFNFRLGRTSIRSWIVVLLFVSTYFFIQLNFELVSHNFGSKFFFFFNNNLFSLEVISLTFAFVLLLIRFNWSSSTKLLLFWLTTSLTTHTNLSMKNLIGKFVPYVCVICWILWSYRPLINYFIWNFVGISVFNSENSLQSVHTVLALSLLIWLVQDCPKLWILSNFLFFITSNWTWILIITLSITFMSSQLHFLLTLFALLNLTLAELFSSFCFPQSTHLGLFTPSSMIWAETEYLTADSYSWELVLAQGTLYGNSDPSWNLITTSNTTNVNSFILKLTHDVCLNYYNLGTSYMTTYLTLELPSILTLVNIFLVTLCLVFFLQFRFYKINF